jgi:RNA-binding protein YlmH
MKCGPMDKWINKIQLVNGQLRSKTSDSIESRDVISYKVEGRLNVSTYA